MSPVFGFYKTVNDSPALSLAIDNAFQEAERLNHAFIGCEHLLLGVMLLSKDVANRLLNSRRIGVRQLRRATKLLISRGPPLTNKESLPLTPRAQNAIEYAETIACVRNERLDVDHLFIGIVNQRESVAVQILLTMGIGMQELENVVANYRNENITG